ncbi:class D beta-lactamase [Sphingomonas sp. CJ20]
MLLGAGAVAAGLSGTGAAIAETLGRVAAIRSIRATLVVELGSGKVLHRSGACAAQFAPCSSFKVPLALMGFDAGILKGPHDPRWPYDPAVHKATRAIDKQPTDPTSWEANSVLWYSQQLTRKLGAARFKAYIDRFGYGNRDVRGNPGKNDGLTEAWLMSSLKISPDEQVAFLRRMLAHKLVSAAAHAQAEAIIPTFEGAGGWRVRGKTGSGWLQDTAGAIDRSSPLGWFVGWADKGARRLVFARLGGGAAVPADTAGGPAMRQAMLAEIGRLAG